MTDADSKKIIRNLALRGFGIMLFAMGVSASLVAWLSVDFPPDLYQRAVLFALVIPMLISPPISLMVGRLNYKYFLLHRKAEWLANHDELTGLLNRRAFRAAAERMLFTPHGADTAQPVILFLADIDHFKRVNDRLGHEAGDEAIRHVANILRKVSPEDAVIARLGGEEFAILTNWTSLADTRRLAAAICRAAETSPCNYEGTLISLTLSIGVAVGSRSEEIGAILKRADQQLYKVKGQGRNAFALAPNLAA